MNAKINGATTPSRNDDDADFNGELSEDQLDAVAGGAGGGTWSDFKKVMGKILSAVAPDSPPDDGGNATIGVRA